MGGNDLIERARRLPGMAVLADLPGVHLVGGAVRDLLLGVMPKDLDLVVEDDVEAAAARLGPPAARHEPFGTITVRRDGRTWDLVRARAESYPRPGALPDTRPGTLEEDLRRRDFTVNTFALELATGTLRCAGPAHDDLAARRLRVLHSHSFEDDPTRVLRLARYRARLGFAIEPETERWARAAVAGGALQTVTPPRIGTELRLAAREPDVLDVFAALRDLEADEGIAPGFGLRDDLGERVLALLPADARRDVAVLAAACRGVADPEEFLARLAFRGEDVRAVVTALDVPDLAGRSPGEVAKVLRTPEQGTFAAVLGAEGEARRWLEQTRHARLAITGADLRRQGAPEGPELGSALRRVLCAVRDGRIRPGRDSELAEALRLLDR